MCGVCLMGLVVVRGIFACLSVLSLSSFDVFIGAGDSGGIRCTYAAETNYVLGPPPVQTGLCETGSDKKREGYTCI